MKRVVLKKKIKKESLFNLNKDDLIKVSLNNSEYSIPVGVFNYIEALWQENFSMTTRIVNSKSIIMGEGSLCEKPEILEIL